jgi:hypothetical protein
MCTDTTGEGTAADIMRALLLLQRQPNLRGVLEAAVATCAGLHAPCHLACLLRDPATDTWFVTALLDPRGRPLPVERYGVPAGPFPFDLPRSGEELPLARLIGSAWGAEASATLEARLGATAAVAAAITGDEGPRGALLALYRPAPGTALLAGVLAHAAEAAACHLRVAAAAAGSGVLPARAFAQRAADEIARAERYQRVLALVTFEPGTKDALAALGMKLVRTLRRWDILGRLDITPALAAVLPETGRGGARGLIRRLGTTLTGVRIGVAVFPEDACSLERLVDVARGRGALAGGMARTVMPDRDSRIWTRRALPGPDSDTVRCPLCLTGYTRRRPPDTPPSANERACAAARVAVQSTCPRHPEQIIVDA